MLWLLGQHVIVCGVLAVVVALCCRVFHIRPAVAHALWLVVLIRLMLPPVVFWPWTLPDFGAAQSLPVNEAAPAVDAASNLAAWKGVTVEPATPSAASAESPATPAPSYPFLDWRTAGWLALALWLAGAIGLVLVKIVRLVRFNHAIGVGKPAPDWLARELSQVASRFGLPDPALRIVPMFPVVPSPFAPFQGGISAPERCLVNGCLKRKTKVFQASLHAAERAHNSPLEGGRPKGPRGMFFTTGQSVHAPVFDRARANGRA